MVVGFYFEPSIRVHVTAGGCWPSSYKEGEKRREDQGSGGVVGIAETGISACNMIISQCDFVHKGG